MPVQGPQTRVPAYSRGVRSSMRKRGNIETGVEDNRINRRPRRPLRLIFEHLLRTHDALSTGFRMLATNNGRNRIFHSGCRDPSILTDDEVVPARLAGRSTGDRPRRSRSTTCGKEFHASKKEPLQVDLKLTATVFVTIFVAEIADKTQIATLLYASNAQHSRLSVFIGSALALIVASGVAVLAGVGLSNWIDERLMARVAGIAFILVGIWTIARG